MRVTPNQHLLAHPRGLVGKSPDLHAEIQRLKPHSVHTLLLFFHTYTRIFCTRTRTRIHMHLCTCVCVCVHTCGFLVPSLLDLLLSVAVA